MEFDVLEKIGLFLIVSGFLLAVHTGNLFGFSREVKDRIDKLKLKGGDEVKAELLYYRINEAIRRLWPVIAAVGLAMLIIGLFI